MTQGLIGLRCIKHMKRERYSVFRDWMQECNTKEWEYRIQVYPICVATSVNVKAMQRNVSLCVIIIALM